MAKTKTKALLKPNPTTKSNSPAQGHSHPTARGRRDRGPRRSLRTILILWFLLFSVIPVAFVTGYSLIKYEQAIDNELVQRLRANLRELNATVSEYEKYLSARMQRHSGDTSLIAHLSMGNIPQARVLMRSSVRNSLLTSLSLFNREGRLVAALTQDEKADAKENADIESQNLFLNDANKKMLDEKEKLVIANPGPRNSLDLVMMTRLKTSTGRPAGYIEEIINIGSSVLGGLKKRLQLEIILFDGAGQIVAGSHPDFLLYPKDYFAKLIVDEAEVFFDLPVRREPFGVIVSPVEWGDQKILIGVGASKQKAKAVLKDVNYAFFTVIGAIVVLAVIMALVGARAFLKPLDDLLVAIESMDQDGSPVEVVVHADNELGVLAESFNEMSARVRQARSDLEKKIVELEQAYSEIKDAQTKLVHAAKMAGLGQLVAGVAHELNNPIGFIYSNMTHLRDYSERLCRIIDAGRGGAKDLEKSKLDHEFAYIIEDLPRLIRSCEDGAQRVRDIVLGLRNFSRLEEAKLKEVDLSEGIQETLRLLAGELKGRIRVHTEFGQLPEVYCYASQINQVFMNILSNAAQSIEGEGEIFVTTSLVSPREEGVEADIARISIRDTGKGMSADIAERIFDPFFTTKSIGQGTGLGLSITYGIVKKHGGEIIVASEPGKGTEFVITLPVEGPPGAPQGRLAQGLEKRSS